MVLTILWQVYMLLSAYESIQACQLMEELLGRVKQGFCTFIGLNFKWKHEHKQREAKWKSKQWRRGKQRTAVVVFFRTFGALPEVHFLHAIYHFKYQEVKNPTLQTVYNLELKWERYGLRKTTTSSHGNTISQGDFLHGAKFGHFAPWRPTLRNLDPSSFPFRKCLWNPLFLHARTTDFPDIFSLIFSRVNSFCNLVFNRHKALSCNFSIYRGAQRLQKMGWLADRSSVH